MTATTPLPLLAADDWKAAIKAAGMHPHATLVGCRLVTDLTPDDAVTTIPMPTIRTSRTFSPNTSDLC